MKHLPKRQPQKSLKLYSPAKVNLFFYLLSKRKDGYHEIATLMQTIDLFDQISFTLSSKDQFTTNSSLLWDKSNLIYKAVQLFQEQIGSSFSISIDLQKHIPMGAGLAGGSSNAATTLWALNELHNRPLSIDELHTLGKEVGSDVPLFLSYGRALCTGRGEIVKNLPQVDFSAMLFLSEIEISTPKVYQQVVIERKESLVISEDLPKINELEKPAFTISPALKEKKRRLEELGFTKVVMTGSGSAFVCYGKPKDLLQESLLPIKGIFREKGSWYKKRD